MSGIVNRIREGVHEATRPKETQVGNSADHHTHTPMGVAEGTAGPHSSRAANAADPRVDSDLDNRAHAHNHTTTAGYGGATRAGTTGVGSTAGSTNAGPHDSNLMNKLDPRVDSDLDGSRNAGMNQTTGPTGRTHVGATHSGTTGVGTTTGSTNAGPHNSNVANKLDPRVDSDLDGSRNAGMNQTTGPTGRTHTGATHHTGTAHHAGTTGVGTTAGSTNAGPHDSNLANKMDPRVDSDLDGGRHAGLNQTTTTAGRPVPSNTTATAGTTGSTNAGPHKSNLLNKLDPRVDSDLDGSRNAGMNQTTRPNY